MRNLNNCLRCLAIGLLAGLAWQMPSALASTLGELSDTQSQTILTEARLRLAEAQAKLKALTGENVSSPSTPATVPMGDRHLPLPVVRAIYGVGGRMTASFLFPGGYEADGGAGQELPGGYRVDSVQLDRVMLSRDGQRFPVGFSHRVPSPPAPGPESVSPLTPALPGASLPALQLP